MQDTSKKNGRLTAGDLKKLKEIILRDYHVDLNDEEVNKFGISLLKITRLAITAFNRAEDKRAITTTS